MANLLFRISACGGTGVCGEIRNGEEAYGKGFGSAGYKEMLISICRGRTEPHGSNSELFGVSVYSIRRMVGRGKGDI